MCIGVQKPIREITDDEVAFYEQHGWVKLDGLVSAQAAADLLDASKQLIDRVESELKTVEPENDSLGMGKIRIKQRDEWKGTCIEHHGGARTFVIRNIRVAPFFSFIFSDGLGRAAAHLINRASLTDETIPIRYMEDALLCREPSMVQGSSNGTFFHQDHPDFQLDRVGALNFWIALDEVTPEQGAMRFLDRSHQAGPLGELSATKDLIARYPKLAERYEWTAPFHYKPGDATVHHQLLVHGAPENVTNKRRWAYACIYMPADCVVGTNGPRRGMPEPHERFPIVYQ